MHIDCYNEQSLHRMGYCKVDGRWVRRGSGQVPVGEDEEKEHEDMELHISLVSPPNPAPATSKPPTSTFEPLVAIASSGAIVA